MAAAAPQADAASTRLGGFLPHGRFLQPCFLAMFNLMLCLQKTLFA